MTLRDGGAALKRTYNRLRGGYVCSYGSIVYIAFADKTAVREKLIEICRCIVITEVQEDIYLIICYSGHYLVYAALPAGQKLLNLESRGIGNHFARCFCSAYMMLCQNAAVSYAELNHKLFLCVMCYDSYFHIFFLSLLRKTAYRSVVILFPLVCVCDRKAERTRREFFALYFQKHL